MSRFGGAGRGGGRREIGLSGVWLAALAGLAGALWFSACGRPGETGAKSQDGAAAAGFEHVEIPPGWHAKIASGQRSADAHFASAAFALEEGESLDPGVPPDGLVVTFTGDVAVEAPGRYRLGVECRGGIASLTVYGSRGQRLAEASAAGVGRGGAPATGGTSLVELPEGTVTVGVKFERSGTGRASLRTRWEKQGIGLEGFRPEPIPTRVVAVPPFARSATAAALAARDGRMMMGMLNCAACHEAPPEVAHAIERMPAPLLGQIGARASPEWIHGWITNPRATGEHALMPDVIGDSNEDMADAEAITHFLVSLGGPAELTEPQDGGAPATEARTLDLGRRLYHTVGCVACHGAQAAASEVLDMPWLAQDAQDDQDAGDHEHGFGPMAGRWRPRPLASFLKDPLSLRPDGRMPSQLLSDEEADLIANYLVHTWDAEGEAIQPPAQESGTGFQLDGALVERGRIAFAERGCASCHAMGENVEDVAPMLKATGLAAARSGKGCLDPQDQGSPRFAIDERDRAALSAALSAVQRAAGEWAAAPIDRGARLVEALECRHCHELGGHGGPYAEVDAFFITVDETELGDEGRLPPTLDGAGWKLTSNWMERVLAEGGRARPYMATRMPQFGEENARVLARFLKAGDGVFAGEDRTEPTATSELVAGGRTLVGENGNNCISCHLFADLPPAGTPGPDLAAMAERVRFEWFKTYMAAPARFKPGTRMTAFWGSGKNSVEEPYAGEYERQTDAIWAYLTLGKFAPAPEGAAAGSAMPLRVGERPVVFRTFLKSAGSRGIAVGFPAGVHFAFDAQNVRLAEAWRGDFVDATGAWKGRGGEVSALQGQTAWNAPQGPALVIGESAPGAARFRGYSLDGDGVPTFEYDLEGTADVGGVRVRERFEPAGPGEALFTRMFEIAGLPGGERVWIAAGEGASVIEVTGGVVEGQSEEGGGDGGGIGVRAEDGVPLRIVLEVRP